MSMPWFRLYSEFASDPKVQLLAFEDQRHFVVLLCLKCNGTLDTDAVNPSHFDRLICKALGLDPASGSECKRRLLEVGLITENWQPAKWQCRQYQSDSSTERTRKYREKTKGTSRERHSDGVVTDKNRTEQNRTERTAGTFVPPSLKEIQQHMRDAGAPDSEAVKFHSFYESKAWMVGKNKMKNWKAAATGWIARNSNIKQDPSLPPELRGAKWM